MPGAHLALAAILATYLALASLYAWLTPRWNNPDEPAHYNYIAEIAELARLPVLEPGDWDAPLLERLKEERFHPRYSVDQLRYESHQPPLYYLLAVPVYRATAGASLRARVLALRLVSITLGLLLGLLVFRLAQVTVAGAPAIPPLAAGIALLIPMNTAVLASINNDVLAEVLGTLTLVVMIQTWRSGVRTRGALALGAMAGVLLLTKLTVYVFAVLIFGLLAARIAIAPRYEDRLRAAGQLGIAAAAAITVSGWWFARNAAVYGWWDPLATQRHAEVVAGQPQWAHYGPEAIVYFGTTLFHSFWAQFAWMAVVVDDLLYWFFGLFVVLAALGLALGRRLFRDRASVTLLSLAVAGVLAQLLYYNLSFIQVQGRYLFPAIGPIVLILAAGWSSLMDGDDRLRRAGATLGAAWALLAAAFGLGYVAEIAPDWPALVFLIGLAAWVGLGAGRAWWRLRVPVLTGMVLLGLAALNLACLAHFIVPYFG